MRAAPEMPLQAGAHMTISKPDRPAWSSIRDVTPLYLHLLHLQACWVAEELGHLTAAGQQGKRPISTQHSTAAAKCSSVCQHAQQRLVGASAAPCCCPHSLQHI